LEQLNGLLDGAGGAAATERQGRGEIDDQAHVRKGAGGALSGAHLLRSTFQRHQRKVSTTAIDVTCVGAAAMILSNGGERNRLSGARHADAGRFRRNQL